MLTRVLPMVPLGRGGAVEVGIATAAGLDLRSRLDFLRFFSFRVSFGCGEFARLVRRSRLSFRPCLRVPPGVLDLEDDFCEPRSEDRLEEREEDLELLLLCLLLCLLPGAALRGD